MSDAELNEKEYKKYCTNRKTMRGPRPKLTGCGMANSREDRMKAWIYRKEVPNDDIVRMMFCDAIGVMIEKTMEKHDYKFNGKIYRQKQGGAIGMDLTGVIADIYMCEWDKKMMQIMTDRGYD